MPDFGWIKLYRKIRDHHRYSDPEWLAVWVWMLMEAAWGKRQAVFDGKTIELLPGQFVAGRQKIAATSGVSESKTRRVIEWLKNDQQIDQVSCSTCSLFTIRNWAEYQDFDQPNGQQTTNERPTNDQRTANERPLYIRTKKGRREEGKNTTELELGSPGAKAAVPEGSYHPDTRAALHILNEATGRHYREVDSNLRIISARLKEPCVDLDGVRQMIARQCERWKSDQKMAEYLRPETLFGKEKFDAYYAARSLPVASGSKPNERNDRIGTSESQKSLEEQWAESDRRNGIDPD